MPGIPTRAECAGLWLRRYLKATRILWSVFKFVNQYDPTATTATPSACTVTTWQPICGVIAKVAPAPRDDHDEGGGPSPARPLA
jgi:hypothetical protein